ncbi:hypothetical protein ASZ78_008722 [Callipepla squamata]|uniref:Sfi1 spindle body domain-containing protein n=1 Tax=Callipepla squamata TaxID=9009 RepID=A0A226NAK0_CALSU|nr:hypothetical protein ASZ78_008722 [Callipepla squamata]
MECEHGQSSLFFWYFVGSGKLMTHMRVLTRHVFDTWLVKVCKQQEYRMGENRLTCVITIFSPLQAVLHFERQLLVSFWCFWRRRTAACLEEQEDLARARDHYRNVLLLNAFHLWKQNSQERKVE